MRCGTTFFRCREVFGPSSTSRDVIPTSSISWRAVATIFRASSRSRTDLRGLGIPRPARRSASWGSALNPERPDTTASGRGNISRWCIEHPYVVIAFYLGVALLAVIVIFFQMPRRMMPYVESPIVAVVSMMPGLSAEEMETYFSKPIEERMVDLKNVHFVRSTSQEGFSIVSVEFWYGTDMKKALFDVQSLMNVVQADLPMTGANLKPSWVLAIDPLNIPILSLAVTGDGYDPVQLRTLVENEIVNRLKVVKDVYSVVPFGGQKLQMQVIVDRERLAAYRMSLLDLKTMLDMQNQARPAGTLTFGA